MDSEQMTTLRGAGERSLQCPQCGRDTVTTTMHCHTFDYGTGESAVELTVDLPVRRCAPCDYEYLDEVAEDLQHEAVCKYFGVLAPHEIRRIRKDHGMTRTKFAEVSGLGEASLNRWENGLNIQTHAYDRYLRLLALPGTLQRLRDIVKQGAAPPEAGPITDERRFRKLKVSDKFRRDQENFRLRLAA